MKGILLALAAVAALLLFSFMSLRLWYSWAYQPYILATVVGDGDLRLDIIAQVDEDVEGLGLCCEVWRGTQLVSGATYMGMLHDRAAQFDLLPLRGGSLTAVYEHKRPHSLLIVYDAKTGECWPDAECAREEEDATHDRLLARVKEVTGDADFELTMYSD